MKPILEDSIRERVQYDAPDMPLYIRKSTLSDYSPTMSAACHWHRDLEFMYMIRGYMDYNVDGEIYHMDEGDGIFVNANHLHYGYSPDGSDSEFICILLTPDLLDTAVRIQRKYILPVTEHDIWKALVLEHEEPGHRKPLHLLREIYQVYAAQEQGFELELQSLFFRLWLEIFKNAPLLQQEQGTDTRDRIQLKAMLRFIHEEYPRQITAEDIANAGTMSASKCFKLFRKYLRKTPVETLTEYRLMVGCEMLASTQMTMTEIAGQTGFSNSSYFTERFRQYLGMTPREYRRKHAG